MSFVVDGAEWDFDGLADGAIIEQIEATLAFVAISTRRKETVWVGDDLQSRPVRGGDSLWQLAGGSDFPGEVAQELAAWLGQANYYMDMAEWPDGADETEISVTGAPAENNVDVAWVHHTVRSGKAMACLSHRRSGKLSTASAHGAAEVHFVRDEVGRLSFWRDAIKVEGDNAASLQRFAPNAYPNVYFADGVLANVERLAGGYLALRADVQAAFEALDQHGCWIFTEAPPAVSPMEPRIGTVPAPSNQIIEKRFENLALDAAPEKPNVRQDRTCREAREATCKGVVVYCEWHIKLQPHQNRIHVHRPIPESGNRVIVGMIHEHLPLP